MFRTIAKVPLRRFLHTSSPRITAVARPSRVNALAAGSAVAAAYLTYKTLYGEKIALDSIASSSKQVPLPAKSNITSDDAFVSVSHGEPADEPASAPDAVPAEGEQEESSGGAFNPVTGEINWDCPCLGGMAYGPCGLQFREAFSCFVFSEQEPKGIDCVEKFKAMQNCFREHPEVYGDEIMGDDDDEEDAGLPASSTPAPPTTQTLSESQAESPSKPSVTA